MQLQKQTNRIDDKKPNNADVAKNRAVFCVIRNCDEWTTNIEIAPSIT